MKAFLLGLVVCGAVAFSGSVSAEEAGGIKLKRPLQFHSRIHVRPPAPAFVAVAGASPARTAFVTGARIQTNATNIVTSAQGGGNMVRTVIGSIGD